MKFILFSVSSVLIGINIKAEWYLNDIKRYQKQIIVSRYGNKKQKFELLELFQFNFFLKKQFSQFEGSRRCHGTIIFVQKRNQEEIVYGVQRISFPETWSCGLCNVKRRKVLMQDFFANV